MLAMLAVLHRLTKREMIPLDSLSFSMRSKSTEPCLCLSANLTICTVIAQVVYFLFTDQRARIEYLSMTTYLYASVVFLA